MVFLDLHLGLRVNMTRLEQDMDATVFLLDLVKCHVLGFLYFSQLLLAHLSE
jgi:hypothetical protein